MERHRAPRRASPTRTSLRACLAEGVVAEVIAACCGGAAIAAWAFQLEASSTLIGLLFGLAYFSQLLQFPAAWITSRFGRRKVAIAGHAASRIILIGLAPLPFLPLPIAIKQAVLVAILLASASFVVIGHNAWLVWVTDLVPARIRGRYFGKRTAYATAMGTVVALSAGLLLDRARKHGDLSWTLSIMAVLGWCAGLVTAWLMSKQHEPGNEHTEPMRFRDMLAPLRDTSSRRLLGYQILWNAAVGLTVSVVAVYMLRVLHFGFVGVGIYNAIFAGARIVSAPFWGRAVDRVGSRPVMMMCALGVALSSSLWMFAVPGWFWFIAIEAVLSGLLMAGHEIALFALPLAIAPRKERPVHLAAYQMVAGLAFGLASIGGGAAGATAVGTDFWLGPRMMFALSSTGRLLAAFVGAALLEPHARSLLSLVRAGFAKIGGTQREATTPESTSAPACAPSAERGAVSGM